LDGFGSPPEGMVLIAASMGGTRTLPEVLPLFGKLERVSMIIVQHMPSPFTRGFASRLSDLTDYPIAEATNGGSIVAGRAYLAPGSYHTVVRKASMGWYRTFITSDPPVKGVRPSADVTFSSVAGCVKLPIAAIILTGMGSDGTDGCRLLREKGAYVIAQDEMTSIMYSMPRSVKEEGLADAVLPASQIPASALRSLRSRI